MEVPLVENAVIDTQHIDVGFDIFQSDDCRFLHHVAQITCQRKFRTFAFRQRSLDEQYLATHAGPCQSRYHASIVVTLVDIAIEGGLAQQVFNLCRRNLFVRKFASFSLFESQFAQGFVYLFLQLTYTTFARVLLNNLFDSRLVEGQLLVVQTRIFFFFGNQMTFGNLILFFSNIATYLNNFHTVQQGAGDST